MELNCSFRTRFEGVNNSVLNTIVCSYEDVEKMLDKLNKFQSPGPDNLIPVVLKNVKLSIIDNLVKIFNYFITSCSVPLDWKLANVTPIHKKGNKSHAENYRPISLTLVVGKPLETIVTNHISNHLESNNLLKDTQHGFRRHRSCLTNLLEVFHEVYLDYDNNKAFDIIYLLILMNLKVQVNDIISFKKGENLCKMLKIF